MIGVLKTTTLYAVKNRDGRYMNLYENGKAAWCLSIRNAWLTNDIQWANDFAGLIKAAYVVELTVVERRVT